MKTKSTILLAFLVLFTTVSLAQTKEETLEWFKDFGEKLAFSRVKCNPADAEVSSNYKYTLTNDYLIVEQSQNFWGESRKYVTFYKLSNILVEDLTKLKIIKDTWCEPTHEFIEIFYKGDYKVEYINTSSVQEHNKLTSIKMYFKSIEDVQRVINAIMHIAKLSGAKENKQTF